VRFSAVVKVCNCTFFQWSVFFYSVFIFSMSKQINYFYESITFNSNFYEKNASTNLPPWIDFSTAKALLHIYPTFSTYYLLVDDFFFKIYQQRVKITKIVEFRFNKPSSIIYENRFLEQLKMLTTNGANS